MRYFILAASAVTASILLALCFTSATQATAPSIARTKAIIRIVFGSYGDQAVKVSGCETGYTWSVWARNGQYLGLFQMGSYARGRYGHSNNAWGQAQAAYRYFVDSGKDWSPWSCKP